MSSSTKDALRRLGEQLDSGDQALCGCTEDLRPGGGKTEPSLTVEPNVEPTELELVTPACKGAAPPEEVRLAFVDPHLDGPGRVECRHRCCTLLLYVA